MLTPYPELVLSQAGSVPVLLAAPHGGSVDLEGMEPRASGSVRQDARTLELALAVVEKLEANYSQRLYSVVALFHRQYVDANRPEALAFEDAGASCHYRAYHACLRGFIEELRERFSNGGLLIDLHGQSRVRDGIFRGTKNGQTVQRLLSRKGPEALVGPNSIFGQLQSFGYAVFPGNTPIGNPAEQRAYDGGYTVQTYGSHQAGGIDAIQIEIGLSYRQRGSLERLAEDLARAIFAFQSAYML